MSWIGVVVFILDVVLQQIFRNMNIGIENRGVSFGMAREMGETLSLIALCIFISLIIFEKIKYQKIRTSLLLICLGGIGNLISRVIGGSVWDYICVSWLPFCLNLSDLLISFGVSSYILGIDGNRSNIRGQRYNNNQ